MKRNLQLFLGLAIVLKLSAAAWAQDPAPREVRDLIGARASSGEAGLKSAGYEFYNSEKSGDRIYTNWWKQSARTCLTVVTYDGRYDSIVTAPTLDCGLADDSGSAHGGSSGKGKWYDDYIGQSARAAESELERRGFNNVDGTKEGYRSITWWHKADNNHCFKMVVSDGDVESIAADRGACGHAGDYVGQPPQIIVGGNGEGEVIYNKNNCVVYYNRNGRRKESNDNCSRDQVEHADKAMGAYRREQGM